MIKFYMDYYICGDTLIHCACEFDEHSTVIDYANKMIGIYGDKFQIQYIREVEDINFIDRYLGKLDNYVKR